MKWFQTFVGLLVLAAMPVANAAVSDEDFAEVKRMLEDALNRIAELESSQIVADTVQQAEIKVEVAANDATAEQVAANTAALEKLSWPERIALQGDFRYRYQTEETDVEDRSRNRQRIRGRAAIIAQVAGNVEVGLGIATGSDDPVSSNQTLGGSGSSKDINLDLAYVDWQFADNAHLHAGKFKNQFVDAGKSAILWDSDWRPEGFNVSYATEQYYANFLGTWLAADGSSRSGNSFSSGNSFNYGVQVAATPAIGGAKLDVGAGYYVIKAEGRECYNAPSDGFGVDFLLIKSWDNDCFGNTEIVTEYGSFYAMDYAPAELFIKTSFGTAIPIALFANYIVNLDANAISTGPSAGKKLDTAFLVGGSLGKAKKQGEWQIKAYYQDKEADSLLGLLTDSDFAGGGTDSKGVVVKGKYMLRDSIYFQASYLMGERQDSNGYENGSLLTSNPYDVDVLQLDVQFKYE